MFMKNARIGHSSKAVRCRALSRSLPYIITIWILAVLIILIICKK